jgi:hypothetical protein
MNSFEDVRAIITWIAGKDGFVLEPLWKTGPIVRSKDANRCKYFSSRR